MKIKRSGKNIPETNNLADQSWPNKETILCLQFMHNFLHEKIKNNQHQKANIFFSLWKHIAIENQK